MANTIQLKRGLAVNRTGFTPAAGEPLFETDTNKLYVGDGSTLAQSLTAISGNSFSTVAVSGQSDVVADQAADTLTLVAGTNVTITTNAGTDEITFAVSGAGTMDSFNVSGDAGDASDTIGDSETLNIDGGTGITTTLTASTNTLAIAHDAHTGDVTGSTALTIANDAVTYAKMQNVVANNVILGNNAGAGGIVDELTGAEVRTITGTGALAGAETVSGGWTFGTADTTFTAGALFNDNVNLKFGTGTDVEFFFNGTEMRTRLGLGKIYAITDSANADILDITYTTNAADSVVTVGNDLVVTGDLTVSGTTTTINTTDLNVADNIVRLNSDYVGSTPTANAGIEVERGTLTNATLQWNETSDKWEADHADGSFSPLAFEGDLASYLLIADIDDTPVNGVTDAPISSNWAFDHAGGADPHSVYPLQGGTESITGTWTFTNATFDGGTF